MSGKAKPQKHTAKEIAMKAHEAKMKKGGRGGGEYGLEKRKAPKEGKRNIVKTISTPSDIEELKEQLGGLSEINGNFIISNSTPQKKTFFQNIKSVLKGKKNEK